MPLPTLIQTGFSTLLDDIIISDTTGKKAISIFQQHFTFTAHEITKGYQDSYAYTISAITVGLAAPEQKLTFVQKFLHSKITREFADPIEIDYFQPFAQKRNVPSEKCSALRKQLIDQLNKVAKHKDQLFQIKPITQEDLAALINSQGTPALSQLVLEQMQLIAAVDDTLAAFLSQDDLLGKAILFFFHDIIRKDERVEKTQAALQREGLAIQAQNIQSTIKTTQDNFNQAVADQSTQLVEIAQNLQHLQQAQNAWQTRNELFTQFTQQFPAWRKLLDHQVDQLVNGVEQIFEKLDKIDQTVTKTQDLAEQILDKLTELMARQNLSSQVNPRDEFTQHNGNSLEIIREAASQLKQLPTQHPEYSHVSIMVGSALSSTGDLETAERFFRKAIEKAHNQAEKGLAHFNLFQVYLRRKAYKQALADLQAAIKIDPQRYALHDIRKGYYPIERFLGAGGMGCVLLCQNQNRLIRQDRVVVKCFWENLKGTLNEVFMRIISKRNGLIS
jgi:tetratricopeptide (TPR) repeat protein